MIQPGFKPAASSDVSLIGLLASRYLPYWPLYVLLCGLVLTGALVATKYLVPVYKINATLVINDKAKGVEESETLRSLNVYAANKTVENEVQVLKSRTLLNAVVLDLGLYAPVLENDRIKATSAYLTSPVTVRVQNPAMLVPRKHVAFAFNKVRQRVELAGAACPLGQWCQTPYGVLRFEKNPAQKLEDTRELYFSLLDPRLVTDGLLANLDVGASSKLSSVVSLQYLDEVPERGVAVVNALLEDYNRASMVHNNFLAVKNLGFVTDRIRRVEHELDSIQRRIQQFKATQSITDLSQQGKIYLENVADNDRRIADINTQLAVLDKVDEYVRGDGNKNGIVPTTLGVSDPVLADLLQKVNTLEMQRANLRTSSGENNPLTKAVESEIAKTRPGINNIVRSQRARLQAGRANLQSSVNQYGSQLRSLPGKERELLEVSRQQAIKSDVYAFLLKRKEEAELSSVSILPDSRIVDQAEASAEPAASKRLLVLLGALVAGLVLSTGFVFVKESTGGKIYFRSTLEKATTIPVVGEISSQRRFLFHRPFAQGVIRTQVEQLQASLELFDRDNGKQTILVTSNLPGEGKTFVSTKLAEGLAGAGYQTLLLDLSPGSPPARPNQHSAATAGVGDYLRGTASLADLLRPTAVAGLDRLAAGSAQGGAAALYPGPAMEKLFSQLREAYDFIVIDTPATELAIDAYLLGRWADVSLLVARQGITPVDLVQHLDENKKLRALPGLAIVFNGVPSRGFFTRYTGHGYGYGYQKVYSGH